MPEDITLVIHGVELAEEIPGIDRIRKHTRIHCAPDLASLQRHLPKADALLGWNFRATELREACRPPAACAGFNGAGQAWMPCCSRNSLPVMFC